MRLLLEFSLFLFTSVAQAQVTGFLKSTNNTINEGHSALSEKIIDVSKSIDGFINKEEGDFPEPNSKLSVIYSTNNIQNGESTTNAKVSLKMVLPKTQKRFHLFINNLADDTTLETSSNAEPKEEDETYSTGLRYYFKHQKNLKAHMDGGVKIKDPLDPFAKLRLQQTLSLSDLNISFNEQAQWYQSDGYGYNLGLNFIQPLNLRFAVRQTNLAVWTQDDKFFTYNNELALVQKLKGTKIMSYFVRFFGDNENLTKLTSYDVGISFKTELFWKWMHFRITPYGNHTRDNKFNFNPAVSLYLEAIVGKI